MACIQSGVTTDLLTIDAASKAARSTLYDTSGNCMVLTHGTNTTTATGLVIGGYDDRAFRAARFDRLGNVRTGNDQILLAYSCEGATLNSNLFNVSATTMTITQAATTGIFLNASASIAASAYAIVLSQKFFAKTLSSPLRLRARARVVPQTNSVVEFGFCTPVTTTAQIATGAFWRYTSSGSVVPVISFNGSDVAAGTNISSLLSSANYYSWTVVIDDDNVFFAVQDSATGNIINEQTLRMPSTQPKMLSVTRLQAAARVYNATAPVAAPSMYISDLAVIGYDLVTNKSWVNVSAALGLGSEMSPTTYAQTATWANSAAPANATLSNTTASYTTLGGLFSFGAVAGAETDYALFSFTSTSPYSLFITGITIDAYNTGAAVATTPTVLHWGIVTNGAATSLATATLARQHLGVQSFPVGAAVGTTADRITTTFPTPLRTDSGRVVVVMLRMPVASATASQVIRGGISINGYFE